MVQIVSDRVIQSISSALNLSEVIANSTTRIVGATPVGATPEAERLFRESNARLAGQVTQSESKAVNNPELVALLEAAHQAGRENLDKMVAAAREIGLGLGSAMKNPENLTAARAKAKDTSKGFSLN